jgi:glutathione S-transferase
MHCAIMNKHRSCTEFASLDERLAQHPYLLGQDLTVLDIAWFIYAHRLSLAGYPFARLHPRVDAFVQKLRATPEFAKEVAAPPEFDALRPRAELICKQAKP